MILNFNLPMHFAIVGPEILTETGLQRGVLEIDAGYIKNIHASVESLPKGLFILNYPENYYLLPGMIDLHIHGSFGFDTMDGSEDALSQISQSLAKKGTTGYLATTMTAPPNLIEQVLAAVKIYKENNIQTGAELLGVHLEGPFISPNRMGAQNAEYIQKPNIKLFKKWQEISGNNIRLVTIAPEVEGAWDLIKYLKDTGVTVSLGHTDASCKVALQAIDHGATHCTHLYNAMSALHHRTPGVALAVLKDSRVRAELIADGIHVAPEMLDLTLKIKTSEKLVLVTDAMRAQCLGEGEYDLGGQKVWVKNNSARLASGVLAGSVLTLDQAFFNIRDFTGCDLKDAVKMACENPAKQIGVFDQRGSIKIGKKADLVLLGSENAEGLKNLKAQSAQKIQAVFCRGKLERLA